MSSSINSSNSTENEIYKYCLNLNIKLLDIHFKEISSFNKTFNEDAFLVRKGNDVEQRKKQPDIQRNEDLLFRIRNRNSGIKIDNIVSKKNTFQKIELVDYLDNKLWMLLNSETYGDNEKSHYSLYEGDIIRFGKMKFIVHEIKIIPEDSSKSESITSGNIGTDSYDNINKNSEEIFYKLPELEKYKKCKFCLTYNVCLCNCRPEKLIHFQCLKDQFKDIKPINNKNNNISTYIAENFNCKNCSSQYPIEFRIPKNYSNYELLNVDKPKDSNYLILESYGYNNKKIVHLIILKGDKITIGRSENNDLILDDPSIGDKHAEIIFNKKNQKLILESLNNNFDTAVLVRKSIKINEKIINLQVGKMKFEANLKKIN